MIKEEKTVILEQKFRVSKEKLWKALTERDQMIQWYFENIETFEPKTGFKTRFVIENEGRVFPHLWEVTTVVPNKKISYNWKYEGYTGDSMVTFELKEHGHNTTLKLTLQIFESFPQDIPEFKRESCIDGWNYLINQRLMNFLKNK